jgi:hypothetical protein
MNLADFFHPRKEPGQTVYLGLLVLLIAVTSFGFGRLSATQPLKPGLRVVYPEGMQPQMAGVAGAAAAGSVEASSHGQVVASKSGTKYHLLSCPGAQTIREENKIYFESAQDARAAGYEPAANCKGLE